jgi:hypothetical protein
VNLGIFLHLWADASNDISEERYHFRRNKLFLVDRDSVDASAERLFNSQKV